MPLLRISEELVDFSSLICLCFHPLRKQHLEVEVANRVQPFHMICCPLYVILQTKVNYPR